MLLDIISRDKEKARQKAGFYGHSTSTFSAITARNLIP